MAHSLLHAAAERHRFVASVLTDPADRAIIEQFADEVDSLARAEVAVPDLSVEDSTDPHRAMLGSMLVEAFRTDHTFLFDDLLEALDCAEGAGPATTPDDRAAHLSHTTQMGRSGANPPEYQDR